MSSPCTLKSFRIRISTSASSCTVRPPPDRSPNSLIPTPHRIHKRGRRSHEARARRLHAHLLRSLPARERKREGPVLRRDTPSRACGESEVAPKEQLDGVSSRILSSARHFSVWFVNARSVNSLERRGIVQHYLDTYDPDIFGICETWLDEHNCKHLVFQNYSLVHRRDRPGGAPGRVNHGGVVLFRRSLHAPVVTFLEESPIAERIWARVETDLGPFLLGLCYRPPNSSDDHANSLESELERLCDGYVGAFFVLFF